MTFIKQNAGLLRSVRSWGVLGLLLALAVLTVGYGQVPRQTQPAILTADQQLRVQIAKALAEAAQVMKVGVFTDNFVFASRDDVIVVNTGILGLERIGSAELAQGANIGMVYLAGKGPRGEAIPLIANLPPGYYIVRAFVTRGGAMRVQLLDQQGKALAEFPAKQAEPQREEPKPKQKWTLKIECCPEKVTLDWHWESGGIEVTIEVTIK